MRRNAVGFYWTYPVEWAGFTRLPKTVDGAAARSKTIRYQRDLVRRYANDERWNLVHEAVFLETEPDRGSQSTIGPLTKVTRTCQAEDAVLLLVDFSVEHGWRGHEFINYWLAKADIKFIWIQTRLSSMGTPSIPMLISVGGVTRSMSGRQKNSGAPR